MLSKEPVVRSAPKASTASKINELVHNFWIKNNPKSTCREERDLKPYEFGLVLCTLWNCVPSLEHN